MYMGVCINYAIGVEKGRVQKTLDRTEHQANEMKKLAEVLNIPFDIRRPSIHSLYIDIGNCETLAFDFETYEAILAEAKSRGWSYVHDTLGGYFAKDELATADSEHLKRWPEQRILWTSGFTKTQYGKSLVEHRYVAELVRSVAMYASFVRVNDEGDYYHTGEIADAAEAIGGNGALINSLGNALAGTGYDVIKGGETTIKPIKRKKV